MKSYEIAATLEVDGILDNFKSYVVGNGTNVVKTIGGSPYYDKAGTGDLQPCDDGQAITHDATIGQNKNNNCVPYDPR